ncbi:MAG: HPr family phosphocarrier protein [Deltaproteobacteria bacterium]|nr:HPr family phosphocarrier protein [Deltaproteobacteria bacterium]
MDDLDTQVAENLPAPGELLPLSINLIIKNRLGLHARAAGKLVQAAQQFKSQITLIKDDFEADAKSILSLVSLGCPYDTEVLLTAVGEDAEEALKAVAEVFENRFGEI